MSVSTTRKFISAVPVWEKGRSEEMNVSLIFRGKLPRTDDAHIHIAASSRYQIFVNGEFFAAGPARAAHGFYRVGDFDLAPKLAANENTVAIIVAGYNSNSFYLLDEPSFLCAEIVADGGILCRLPIDEVKALGADVVVAVDVLGPLREMGDIKNIFAYSLRLIDVYDNRITSLLTKNSVADLIVAPDLGDISQYKVENVQFSYERGYKCAQDNMARIKTLLK